MFKYSSCGVLALLLTACGAPKLRQSAPTSAPASGTPSAAPHLTISAGEYQIDAGESELRVLVYRAGPLARFGHNHVLVNRAVAGSVSLADPPGASQFRIDVPVADFIVDDAQARREEGIDFAGEVPDDAKTATLRNMLGDALLDAKKFPLITLAGAASPGGDAAGGRMTAAIVIRIAGKESRIEVPFGLETDPRRLSASGSLQLRQSSLGLVPYSLMLGALQVQDEVTIKFRLAASR